MALSMFKGVLVLEINFSQTQRRYFGISSTLRKCVEGLAQRVARKVSQQAAFNCWLGVDIPKQNNLQVQIPFGNPVTL